MWNNWVSSNMYHPNSQRKLISRKRHQVSLLRRASVSNPFMLFMRMTWILWDVKIKNLSPQWKLKAQVQLIRPILDIKRCSWSREAQRRCYWTVLRLRFNLLDDLIQGASCLMREDWTRIGGISPTVKLLKKIQMDRNSLLLSRY